MIRHVANPAVAALALAEVEPSALRASEDRVLDLMAEVVRLSSTADSVFFRTKSPNQPTDAAAEPGSASLEPPDTAAAVAEPRADAVVCEDEDDEPAPVRQRAFTQFGGLLFLVGLIEDLRLVDQLAEALSQRPLRWTLHLLAKRLAPVSSEDPAALAFVGLRPEDAPPDEKAEPALEAEVAQVDAAVTAVIDELEQRLRELELPPEELLRFVCHRPA
ncbi:MAG: hypothetical protein GY953_51315, partial [bacterium]|nr:hypothetical protein [bacterium]